MRTPTAQNLEGFFHGGNHLIALAERHVNDNPQARASTVIDLMRRENMTLSLMAQRYQECKTQGRAVTRPPYTPEPHKAAVPQMAVLAFCAIAAVLAFMFLFARGVVIESDWRMERLCKYYAAEVNQYAIANGENAPCP